MTQTGRKPESFSVAPLAGAWIEILYFGIAEAEPAVAPLAGAWIEITYNGVMSLAISVAPLAGA